MEEGYFVCSMHYFKACLYGPGSCSHAEAGCFFFYSVGSFELLYSESLCALHSPCTVCSLNI